MGLAIILRLGRVSSLTQAGDGFSYSLIDEHQRIIHREDRLDEDAVDDDDDNDEDDDDGQEATHTKQEVTHGSDPRWATSAVHDRKALLAT